MYIPDVHYMSCQLIGWFWRKTEIRIIFGIICSVVLIILKQLNSVITEKLIVGLLVKKFPSSYATLATFVLATETYRNWKFYFFCQWLTGNKIYFEMFVLYYHICDRYPWVPLKKTHYWVTSCKRRSIWLKSESKGVWW